MLSELLTDKTSEERATLKGVAIAESLRLPTYTKGDVVLPKTVRKGYDFEILDVHSIEGGVEVFVRAWEGKNQIGFGKDGSVDVERFRIMNPPILVYDENGDIEVASEDPITKTKIVQRFREDPKEALLQVIEHNLSVVTKHDSKQIVSGRVGNTTTTVFPSFDGAIGSRNSNFTTSRNGSSLFVDQSSTYIGAYVGVGIFRDSLWNMDRGFLVFDTSSISSGDTLISAILSCTSTSHQNSQNSGTNYVVVVSNSQASNSTLATSDWGNIGATEASSTVGFGSITSNNTTYHDMTLNATGEALVIFGGTTKLALRSGDEINNTNAGLASSQGNRVLFNSVRYTGTASDPKLVVEHSAGGPAVNNGFMLWW